MLLPVVPTIGALNLPLREGYRGIGILNGKYHLLKLLTDYRLHVAILWCPLALCKFPIIVYLFVIANERLGVPVDVLH